MPRATLSFCSKKNCNVLVRGDRCDKHPREKTNWGPWQDRKGSAADRGYDHNWSNRIRPAIMQRDAGLCQSCAREGVTREGSIVDHIIPKAQGGDDSFENLEVICKPHHLHKTATERNAKQKKTR